MGLPINGNVHKIAPGRAVVGRVESYFTDVGTQHLCAARKRGVAADQVDAEATPDGLGVASRLGRTNALRKTLSHEIEGSRRKKHRA